MEVSRAQIRLAKHLIPFSEAKGALLKSTLPKRHSGLSGPVLGSRACLVPPKI